MEKNKNKKLTVLKTLSHRKEVKPNHQEIWSMCPLGEFERLKETRGINLDDCSRNNRRKQNELM